MQGSEQGLSRDAVPLAVAEGARWHIELSQLCMCHFEAHQLFRPNDVLCHAFDRYVFKHNVIIPHLCKVVSGSSVRYLCPGWACLLFIIPLSIVAS